MNRRDVLVACLLSAALMALLTPFARQGVDMHHDGIMLKPALDVLSGQVLFRDTFMQYGALTCYLQVVALWIQPTLLSLKLMMVGAYGVTLFFLYAAWRLVLPRSLTIFSCVLFLLFIPAYEKNWLGQYWMLLPWSSVFAMMFQSVGLYALFRIIRGEQPVRWGLILGLTTACVFWCRQPVGLVMFGCLVVIWPALLWTNWRPAGASGRSILLAIIAGFVAVNAVLLGDIMLSGALPEWWYQNFAWHRKWALKSAGYVDWAFVRIFVHPAAGAGLLVILLATAAPGLAKRFRPNLPFRGLVVYYLCLGAVLAWQHERVLHVLALRDGGWAAALPVLILLQALVSIALGFGRGGSPRPTEYYLVAVLAALSLGSLVQYFPVTDTGHIMWSLAPTFGLFAYVYWRWGDWPAPVATLVLSAAFLPAVCSKVQSAAQALARPMVTLTQPSVLRGMKVPPEQARRLGQIMDCLEPILRHQPDIPCALIGNDAMYLCLTNNRTNPLPYFVTWLGLADEDSNAKRWDYIQRVRPLLILHKARWDAVNDFYRRAHYVPLLYVDEDALEIAVPQELADALGLKVYGAGKPPAKP